MALSISDAILNRRSVRKYKDIPVSDDLLLELVKAAAAAPSASNKQPWEFILVSEKPTMDKLRTLHRYTNYNAPAAVIVCGNSKRFYSGQNESFWVQDCSAAIENIMLAALGFELGTCWLGVYPADANIAKAREILAIPDGIIPLGVVYVGYPAETPAPRTQYSPELVHWQKY